MGTRGCDEGAQVESAPVGIQSKRTGVRGSRDTEGCSGIDDYAYYA
jgi:hypothetical protein